MIKKLKKLPVGVQTLDKMIKGGYLYVDKTEYVYKLVNEGVAYFLSRPRRFGKSLLVSTLEEIFKGNKELFKGLKIYDSDWEWEKYPVVRLDFSKQKAENPEKLIIFIEEQIQQIAKEYRITLSRDAYYAKFEELISKLSELNKVVILIDEYDKPLIDHLTDTVLAAKMRSIMKGFYGILKGMDAQLKFVLLTGVSKFSKAGVFSDLNHLDDITMSSDYSGMLGITEEELKYNFAPYVDATADLLELDKTQLLEQVKNWYNGYCFSKRCTQVYNPFSCILFFKNSDFRNYWFESGTPTFLINIIKEREYAKIDFPIHIKEITFSTYELENLSIIPLLFQTGYLTIKSYNSEDNLFTLDFPNAEVKDSFLSILLDRLSDREASYNFITPMIKALHTADFDTFFLNLSTFFSQISYELHINKEKYYQTVFYCVFHLMGMKLNIEYRTNIGRIDVIIETKDIFIFEFKFNKTKEAALQQIKDNKYYEPWLVSGKKIYLIGVNFKDKNIEDWVVEEQF